MGESVSAQAVVDLAAKLDRLELADEERAVLDGIVARAIAEPEVEGFGVVFEVETTDQVFDDDFNRTRDAHRQTVDRLVRGIGLDPTASVWTDMRPRS